MEDEISCDDPQFMTMLETCLLMEIETSKNTFSGMFSFLFIILFPFLVENNYIYTSMNDIRYLSIYIT